MSCAASCEAAACSAETSSEALIDGVAAKDPALAAAIVVDCPKASGGTAHAPAWLVDEVRFTLPKELKPIPAGSVGMGQNSGCEGRVGRIPPVW